MISIAAALQQEIARLPIVEQRAGFPDLSPFCCSLFVFAIENGVVAGSEIRSWLEQRVQAVGRECYIDHIKNGTSPDHTISPQSLAYAIATEAVSLSEVEKIRFDHDETIFTFYRSSVNVVVQNVWMSVRQQITSNRPKQPSVTDYGLYVFPEKNPA